MLIFFSLRYWFQLFTDFFDTETGSKVDKESYKKIAEKTSIPAGEFLFLTDLPKGELLAWDNLGSLQSYNKDSMSVLVPEAAAASEAGMKTSLVVREGNAPLSEDDLQRYNIVATFDELACDLDEEDFPAKEARTEENGEDEEDDEEEVGEEEEEEEEEDAA